MKLTAVAAALVAAVVMMACVVPGAHADTCVVADADKKVSGLCWVLCVCLAVLGPLRLFVFCAHNHTNANTHTHSLTHSLTHSHTHTHTHSHTHIYIYIY